jgi:predicted TIM-barrel fold metal-dependent hydrolase
VAFTNPDCNLQLGNKYIHHCAKEGKIYAFLFSRPDWSAQEFEQKLTEQDFYGAKVYLNFAPEYVPKSEIRIFDFLPQHQLEVLNKLGKVVMLHIPRDKRLKDPVNLAQMIEIEQKYPDVKLVIAHVGRAYCECDLGNAFDILAKTNNMMFDISANTNSQVFDCLIKAVGPERILFGSDLPITRMRMRRIVEDGKYINLVPKGKYGDVSGDPNMREVEAEKAQKLTFFLYEEIDAFRTAALKNNLSTCDIEKIFYENAKKLLS